MSDKQRKVLILNGGMAYHRMFTDFDWEVVHSLEEADLVQFTGGEDVNPALYGEARHPSTGFSRLRDTFEQELYHRAQALSIPCAGICRGGQFLNVMNGGKMYQDVDRHAISGTHKAVDVRSGREVHVTSTHHQMMRPAATGEVLCIANRSTFKEHMVYEELVDNSDWRINRVDGAEENDVEVVLYKSTNTLCFQPHPEHSVYNPEANECAEYYFECLKEIL